MAGSSLAYFCVPFRIYLDYQDRLGLQTNINDANIEPAYSAILATPAFPFSNIIGYNNVV